MAESAVPRQPAATSSSIYTLKPLLQDVALNDGSKDETTRISCVEFWEGNLYIGTFAGELLHYVSLPPETPSDDVTFILASRLEPTANPPAGFVHTGVRSIVILPRSGKACILCNNVLTFHSLPELSPAVGNAKVSKCQWVGALDLDMEHDPNVTEDHVIIGLPDIMRILRIGDVAKSQAKIQFPKCLAGVRRGRFACVADEHQYSLLDIQSQQKIPMFQISGLDTNPAATAVENLAPPTLTHRPTSSVDSQGRFGSPAGHRRQVSLGDTLMSRLVRAQRSDSQDKIETETIADPPSGSITPQRAATPDQTGSRGASPMPPTDEDKPLPPPPSEAAPVKPEAKKTELLTPHILSPSAEEFFLTTGTTMTDAGVGMFVDLEGELAPRGTIEFGRYPTSLAVDVLQDMAGTGMETPGQSNEGFILAAYSRQHATGWNAGVEIQRWDIPGASQAWLELLSSTGDEIDGYDHKQPRVGVTSVYTSQSTSLQEVGDRLRSCRYEFASAESTQVAPSPRTEQGDDQFWSRMNQRTSRTICWHDDQIHLLIKTPLLTQLEAALDSIVDAPQVQQDRLLQLVGQIQNKEATSEAEFLSLAYMKQKISLVAFEDLATSKLSISPQISEKLLIDSDLDPRVILSVVPQLRDDIDQGFNGVRLAKGLTDFVKERLSSLSISLEPDEVLARPDDYDVTALVRRYLDAWRKRKGYGSIPDEAHIFASVDAALLHLLLQQDQQSSLGPGQSTTRRAELYSIVDTGVSCPERAIQLLEEYKRLFVLSRLYGCRKSYGKVLETWQRIMEGEGDPAGELQDSENLMRGYLASLRDAVLVERYGAYLAKRNPALGVQVFTHDTSRVSFEPGQVVEILQKQAPDAVKVYLEHLVFGKKNFSYANELISYYLTSVLKALDDPASGEAKSTLQESYQVYRALEAPKPTYRQFISQLPPPSRGEAAQAQSASGAGLSANDGGWWNDRLRLLELLGGTFGSEFHYDVTSVLARIQPYDQYLVPESIILVGRQGHHKRALHLLTHGLGDYHTSINYCILGGASIFHPAMASAVGAEPPDQEEQRTLFSALLHEFLTLDDDDQRKEQVSELLARFNGWFELEDVLPLIPEDWPLGCIEGFLMGAIRRLVQERAETMITKALSGAENVIVANEFAEKSQDRAPVVVTVENQVA